MNLIRLSQFFLFLLATSAAAEELPVKVFYVGGYRASAAQMRCWEQGARRARPTGYEFQGVAYPQGAGADYESAVNGAAGDIRRIVAEINANPTRRYVIAGHSSGCAIANTIATRASHPERLKQVILDGFASPRIANVACWGARGPGGAQSRNFGIVGICGAKGKVYQDNHCSPGSRWCLHFSLVVKSVPSNLSDFITHGYDGCNTNLDWL